MPFESRLRLEQDPESGLFVVLAPLVYASAAGRTFEVPEGTRTDFESIPPWTPVLLRLLFRDSLHSVAAGVLHDWLYQSGIVPRAEADALFFEALQATRERLPGAWLKWGAVRIGAGLVWRRYRRAQSAAAPSAAEGATA